MKFCFEEFESLILKNLKFVCSCSFIMFRNRFLCMRMYEICCMQCFFVLLL